MAEAAGILWARYESPSGNEGYRVCAPEVPGLVFHHQDLDHALKLVADAVRAVREDAGKPRAGVEIRYNYETHRA